MLYVSYKMKTALAGGTRFYWWRTTTLHSFCLPHHSPIQEHCIYLFIFTPSEPKWGLGQTCLQNTTSCCWHRLLFLKGEWYDWINQESVHWQDLIDDTAPANHLCCLFSHWQIPYKICKHLSVALHHSASSWIIIALLYYVPGACFTKFSVFDKHRSLVSRLDLCGCLWLWKWMNCFLFLFPNMVCHLVHKRSATLL